MVFEMVKAASMAEMMEIFDHAKKASRHAFDVLACSFSFLGNLASILRSCPHPSLFWASPASGLSVLTCIAFGEPLQVSAKLNSCSNYCQVGATAGLSVLPHPVECSCQRLRERRENFFRV
jgi:hypothetical protein